MKTALKAHKHIVGNAGDPKFRALLLRMQERMPTGPLFTTDAKNLWTTYLRSFPAKYRQYHNCNECRHFMERFGGLVAIDSATGHSVPALWHEADADKEHAAAYEALDPRIRKAKITGVFLSEESILTDTGGSQAWEHFRVRNAHPYRGTILNATQAMAEKAEDFKNVCRALEEFSPATLSTALSLLNGDALYRSEKVLGPAQWLADLHQTPKARRANFVWLAVATAPAGFCHPRSSMIGTLLEDLESGMDFGQVKHRFQEKMHPLQYQRPQAPPKAGNIAQAEKIVADLGAAGALRRRFARLDEIEVLWEPQPMQGQRRGVFGYLLQAPSYHTGSQVMTWAKFVRTVVPTARKMELQAPAHGNYAALTTAVDSDAPHIFQWDNPFSWYVYNGGSPARQWGLHPNTWVQVDGLTISPANWFGNTGFSHQGERAFFILNGARDSGTPSACLFPEILKSEFHGIRSVIEAHSNQSRMEGVAEASACGICLHNGAFDVRVRVTDSAGVQSEYRLDRWE